MTRTFIAVELNEGARSYLHQQVQRLARSLPRVRWTDTEKLHLTLAFLGELDDAQLEQALTATEETAQTAQPFAVRMGSLGFFGPAQNPRVIWTGVAGHLQPLLALQSVLAGRLAQAGFPPEERAYSPHLTLARIKMPLTQQELASLRAIMAPASREGSHSGHSSPGGDAIPPESPITHLSVMKSELAREGAQYTCLRRCALGA